ncbi:MAG: hypothetical protein RIC15_02035 [Vicingaceae bacterium]
MIDFFEIELSIIYLLFIYLIAVQIKRRRSRSNPLYKYFIPGMMVRIFGGIALCFIYLFYYSGGDTVNYFKGAVCMNNLMFKNFDVYMSIMGGNLSFENYMAFDQFTGYPPTYMYRDEKTFAVVRFINPLTLLCFKNFLPTTIVLSTLAYSGPWRLFLLFCREFPGLSKQLAVAVLFIPSVFFWGSGLLKDTFTFSAVCWYTFSFYKTFIVKEKRLIYFTYVIMSLWVLISIKPYLFIAIFPGSVLWFTFHLLNKIEGSMFRILYFPMALALGLGVSFSLVSILGSELGKYELNNLLDVAIITQDDLSRDTYGPNSFDIGEFDGSLGDLVSKAPLAISATLFRPFLWEIRNPVMFLSAIENTIVLILFITMLIRIKINVIIRIIADQPIILFSMLFSIFLAYSVGLSTANFGALVRYKIPLLPYFLSSILIIQYYYKYGDKNEVMKEMQLGERTHRS